MLVYLRAIDPRLDALIDALVARRCRVLAYLPGLDDARRKRLQSAQRHVSPVPLRLASLLPECDLFVRQAGNIAGAALMPHCGGMPHVALTRPRCHLLT